MAEIRCTHDMVPAYCALCRPLPAGVLPRGFRTKGGNAYHNDDDCEWLRKGQLFADRKGMEVHPIEPVAWHALSPGQLAPCEACCTPEWVKKHQRQGGGAVHVPSPRQARPVVVDLYKLFHSSTPSSVPDGLVLEDVPGSLSRWIRSAEGGWIGVVTWVGRTADGRSVQASDQWVPADALRQRDPAGVTEGSSEGNAQSGESR